DRRSAPGLPASDCACRGRDLAVWSALAGGSRRRRFAEEIASRRSQHGRVGSGPRARKGGRIPMAFRRWRWYVRLLVGFFLIPPLLWLVVVLVAPTGWAKRHVVAVLESRSGRSVGLERLSVCPFGGIHLTNLEIGSRHGGND